MNTGASAPAIVLGNERGEHVCCHHWRHFLRNGSGPQDGAGTEEWERAVIEPVLARVFDTPKAPTTEPKEVRDGEARRTHPLGHLPPR